MKDYFRNQCPARGYGLTHTQNMRARPDGSCMDCGTELHNNPPTGVPESAKEAERLPEVYADVYDHKYVFSITGRCARCGKVELRHAEWVTGVEPGECAVDHASIRPWTSCLICFQVIEPKLATGKPVGPPDRPGRGILTERQKGRLNFHAYAEREAAKKEGWLGN